MVDQVPASDSETTEATATEILREMMTRLEAVSKVIGKEYTWLKPKVDEARADLEEAINLKFKDEDERGWDDLYIKSSQVDKHLENLQRAADITGDIASYIRLAFLPTEGEELP